MHIKERIYMLITSGSKRVNCLVHLQWQWFSTELPNKTQSDTIFFVLCYMTKITYSLIL